RVNMSDVDVPAHARAHFAVRANTVRFVLSFVRCSFVLTLVSHSFECPRTGCVVGHAKVPAFAVRTVRTDTTDATSGSVVVLSVGGTNGEVAKAELRANAPSFRVRDACNSRVPDAIACGQGDGRCAEGLAVVHTEV